MDVPLLLTAVSATSPCGEDMEYDAQFLQLERDAKGQPERSMGDSILPAEPPEWRSIQQQSLDLLQRSKDLRITHFLLQSTLALQGVAGLAEVLTLIDALLRQYWADLHPRLDADDDNDPTVRINALTGLTCETNIRLLRESILTRSRTFGPVTLRAALNASGLQSFADEQLGNQQLNAAFLDSDPEQLQATRDALSAARAACEAIEQQVNDQVGSAQGVDLSALKQPLKQALQLLNQAVPGTDSSSDPEAVSEDNALGRLRRRARSPSPFWRHRHPRRCAAQPRQNPRVLHPPRAFEPAAGAVEPSQESGTCRLCGHRAQSDSRWHVPI